MSDTVGVALPRVEVTPPEHVVLQDDPQDVAKASSSPQGAPSVMIKNSVQTFGKKKTATAVAHCRNGKGLIRINGSPIELVKPEVLRIKIEETLRILGRSRFANLDIRIKVSGGGFVSRIYAIRQALAKAIVAYYQKFEDELSKIAIRSELVRYDRSLLVADPRRCEPKKFGGKGARSRYQKSYR